MATVTIQMEDTLQDNVDQAISEIKDAITNWIADNPDANDICLHNDINYDGRMNEIVDGCTPIYTKEIDDTHYLHGDDLLEAYKQAGIYDEPPENFKQVCIYIYIEQGVNEWWHEQEIDLDAWRESGESFEDFIEWSDSE